MRHIWPTTEPCSPCRYECASPCLKENSTSTFEGPVEEDGGGEAGEGAAAGADDERVNRSSLDDAPEEGLGKRGAREGLAMPQRRPDQTTDRAVSLSYLFLCASKNKKNELRR